jgi:hypothetical protein
LRDSRRSKLWGQRSPFVGVPLSIFLFCCLATLTAVSAGAVGVAQGRIAASVFILAVVIAVAAGVYGRSRIAWIVAAGAPLLRLVTGINSPQPLWVISIEAVAVLLLLTPSSLRFIWAEREPWKRSAQLDDGGSPVQARVGPSPARADEPPVRDARFYSDAERPAGWYVDPDSPKRMRYWQEQGRWTGSSRTPKAVLAQWRRDVIGSGPT